MSALLALNLTGSAGESLDALMDKVSQLEAEQAFLTDRNARLSMVMETTQDMLDVLEKNVSTALEAEMTDATTAACLGICMRLDALVTSECANGIVDAVNAGGIALLEDPMAVLETSCPAFGNLTASDDPEPPPTVVEERYLTFTRIRLTLDVVLRTISLLFVSSAALQWADFDRSRRHVGIGALFFSIGPFLFAAVPWYTALQFDDAIAQTHAVANAALKNASQDTILGEVLYADNASLASAGADALMTAQIAADSYRYRNEIVSNVQGSMLGITLAFAPALRKACTMWKFIVPELSLWGYGIKYLPYYTLAGTIVSWTYWNQALSHYLFTLFVVISGCSSLWFPVLLRGVNSSAQKSLDLKVYRKRTNQANSAYLAFTLIAYGFCIAYALVMVLKASEEVCAVLPGVTGYLSAILDLPQVVLWTLGYFAQHFLFVVVCVDALSYVATHAHADCWGKGAASPGLRSIVAYQAHLKSKGNLGIEATEEVRDGSKSSLAVSESPAEMQGVRL